MYLDKFFVNELKSLNNDSENPKCEVNLRSRAHWQEYKTREMHKRRSRDKVRTQKTRSFDDWQSESALHLSLWSHFFATSAQTEAFQNRLTLHLVRTTSKNGGGFRSNSGFEFREKRKEIEESLKCQVIKSKFNGTR